MEYTNHNAVKYSSLLRIEPNLSLDSDDLDEQLKFLDKKPASFIREQNYLYSHTQVIFAVVNILILFASCVLCTIWYYNNYLVLNAALRRTSSYSPIHSLLDLEMHLTTINGTAYPRRDSPSIARQLPNPRADEVWYEYEVMRIFPVSSAQIRAMGKDPSTVAKLPNSLFGLGDDAYASILDVYHQLHCLNQLRRLLYPDHYNISHSPYVLFDAEHLGKTHMQDTHIGHCLDILMQGIQCSGNVNLLPMHWQEMRERVMPDMSAVKQCVNFDKLTQWRIENTVDLETFYSMKKPDGVVELKSPDRFWEDRYPGVENPNHINGSNPGEDFNF